MKQLYESRPFRIRNADDYELEHILELFIAPSLKNPFDYDNELIRGEMGSGKTMLLRSNYAYHLYSLVPNMLECKPCIYPIFINLSEFQNITDPVSIYHSVLKKIFQELIRIPEIIQNAEYMVNLHNGMRHLPRQIVSKHDSDGIIDRMLKMEAKEYKERISKSKEIGISAAIREMNFNGKVTSQKDSEAAFEKKNCEIADIKEIYDVLSKNTKGKILLLLDEVGSLDKSFFKKTEGGDSKFEILMNQFRTMSFIRTKIAVYPNTFSDILFGGRYGDIINLNEDVRREDGHLKFRSLAVDLIRTYIQRAVCQDDENCKAGIDESLLFGHKLEKNVFGDLLEQLIFTSSGNLRTFVHVLDKSMTCAYQDHKGDKVLGLEHLSNAAKEYVAEMEKLFTPIDIETLDEIVKKCRKRSYRFTHPNNTQFLNKFTAINSELKILEIIRIGTGRAPTIYAFSYIYCLGKDIPTHYMKESERLDKTRSLKTGAWINRQTNITEEIFVEGESEAIRVEDEG